MKLKRICSVVLACSLFASVVTGCKKQGSETSDGDNTLTYYVNFNGAALGVESFADLPPIKELMKKTGANIKFMHPVSGMGEEQFNVMIASGEYPDIIASDFVHYQGGPQAAIDEGVIIPLNDVIDKYCPNFKKYMDEHPEYKKDAMTDDGKYYVFPAIYEDDYLQVYSGLIVRKDILDKFGLAVPETIDEWENVLKTCKEGGIESPLILSYNQIYAFIQAFGTTSDLYVDNGKIKYGEVQNEYKKGMELLCDWYSKGYIDTNIASVNSDAIKVAMINGTSIAAYGATGGGIGSWMSAMKGDSSYNLVAAPYPVLKKGDTPFYGHRINAVWPDKGVAISTACKNVELAAKVLDYGYGEEGRMLFNFGIEGESYTMVDGYPTYTEKMTNDPSGRSLGEMISYYARPNGVGPYVIDKRYMEQNAALPQQKESIVVWGKTDAKKHLLPTLFVSDEENEEAMTIKSNLDSYVSAEKLKFITGVKSMNEYDSYVSEIKKMNVDKYVQAYQNAYDRFLKR